MVTREAEMASIYEGGVKNKTVRLTTFRYHKLKSITDMFGLTDNEFFNDCIDYFSLCLIEVQSGRVTMRGAVRDSMQKQLDEYVELKQLEGKIPVKGWDCQEIQGRYLPHPRRHTP